MKNNYADYHLLYNTLLPRFCFLSSRFIFHGCFLLVQYQRLCHFLPWPCWRIMETGTQCWSDWRNLLTWIGKSLKGTLTANYHNATKKIVFKPWKYSGISILKLFELFQGQIHKEHLLLSQGVWQFPAIWWFLNPIENQSPPISLAWGMGWSGFTLAGALMNYKKPEWLTNIKVDYHDNMLDEYDK